MEENKKRTILFFVLAILIVTFLVFAYLIWGKVKKTGEIKEIPASNISRDDEEEKISEEDMGAALGRKISDETEDKKVARNEAILEEEKVTEEEVEKTFEMKSTDPKITSRKDDDSEDISEDDIENALNKRK